MVGMTSIHEVAPCGGGCQKFRVQGGLKTDYTDVSDESLFVKDSELVHGLLPILSAAGPSGGDIA